MGEVFQARDTRLGRVVAIKVLPEALAHDESRRSRLKREARIISQLNHPHICTLHDYGSEGGIDFLVMEHLEGHSLADRLTRGALPLDQVLRIGIEIAEALHRAHRQHVVHRDLKPGNVMLTRSGVKLLDFGLAKFADGSDASVTTEGTFAGTPRYMAPEQMGGHGSDHRADIFALGCVLYEMRTGKPAVGGAERVTPPELDHVIAKCLEQDPERRWQGAGDIAEELRWIAQTGAGRRVRWKRAGWLAAALLVIAALIASFAMLQSRRAKSPPLRATFTRLTDAAGVEEAPAISPDGTLFVFQSSAAGNADIYLQRVGGGRSVNLTADSAADDGMPAFSPDGQRIAFRSERDGGGIFVMGATGESVRRVSDFGYNPAWSPDGKELAVASQPVEGSPYTLAPTGELWRIELTSGRARKVFHGDGVSPAWSPSGDRIAFCKSHGGDILSIPSAGGRATAVTQGAPRDWAPVWARDGHVYFSSNRGGSINLWRIAVDEATGSPRGEPEPLATPALWSGPLGISSDGKRAVYCARNPQSSIRHVSFDPAREMVIGVAIDVPLGNVFVAMPDLSPDGQWIAFNSLYEQEDVYVIRSDGSGLRKLTDDGFTDTWPRWSPDGNRIAFASSRAGATSRPRLPFQIWTINADGDGLRQLTDLEGGGGPPLWSPDARRLVVRSGSCKGSPCVVDLTGVVPVRPGEAVSPLIVPYPEGYWGYPQDWSPDGRWLVGTAWLRDNQMVHRAWVYSVETGIFDFSAPPLTGAARLKGVACWMSDSKRFLLLDGSRLYVVDRVTSRAREIHSLAAPSDGIALSKDDRTIYFLSSSDQADIWLAQMH